MGGERERESLKRARRNVLRAALRNYFAGSIVVGKGLKGIFKHAKEKKWADDKVEGKKIIGE